MAKLNVNFTYPNNQEYEYESKLERINLDSEREYDISHDNGFIISVSNGIKKDIKDPNGIYSPKYGPTLKDLNPFADRYKCDCGFTKSRINNGMTCKICGTKVKYVDDNFKLFGWKVINDYYIIHPNLYKSIEFLIGKDFIKIIEEAMIVDEDGNTHPAPPVAGQPYCGLGMIGFREKFDEIMEYYRTKNPNKEEYYIDIMNNKDKIFIQSIPYFTTHLRPWDIDKNSFYFEDSNGYYTVITKLIDQLNDNKIKMNRKKKPVGQLLANVQSEYMKLYASIEEILSGKKGVIRTLFGGRYNFSSRCVIVADPALRIDEITLPYKCLIVLLEQSIANILHKTHNMSFNDAHNYIYRAKIQEDKIVKDIINSIIKSKPRGLEIIINRNPSIQYGSILQMFCVKMTSTYTMAVPLQILPLLAADFDGDVLNILYIINQDFFKRAFAIFNPRNSMYISRNDGQFDNSVNHQRDTIINANGLIQLSRKYYSESNVNKILTIKNMYR